MSSQELHPGAGLSCSLHAEFTHQTSEDVLHVEEGALYPALHHPELRGLLASEWGASANDRRAKYYWLTAAGRKRLATEAEHWIDMSAIAPLTSVVMGTAKMLEDSVSSGNLRYRS